MCGGTGVLQDWARAVSWSRQAGAIRRDACVFVNRWQGPLDRDARVAWLVCLADRPIGTRHSIRTDCGDLFAFVPVPALPHSKRPYLAWDHPWVWIVPWNQHREPDVFGAVRWNRTVHCVPYPIVRVLRGSLRLDSVFVVLCCAGWG